MVRQQESRRPDGADSAAIPSALGGMLAVGLLVAPAPAAAAAGGWLLAGIPLAALVAGCCAVATATVSTAHPGSGGGYTCVRAELGVIPARVTGVTRLVGHVAGLAAVAGALADHLVPMVSERAATAALLLTALAATAGARVPRAAFRWSVAVLLGLLAVVVACAFAIPPAALPPAALPPARTPGDFGGEGVTGAAGVFFFGFLGFERLVRSGGARAATRRVPLLLAAVAAVVLLMAAALLYQLGSARLALSPTPVLDLLGAADAAALRSVIAVGAALVLVLLLPRLLGGSRATAQAMAADGELPAAVRSGRGAVGLDLVSALAAAGLVWWWDSASALALAACCFLAHYTFVLTGARMMQDGGRGWGAHATCLGMGLTVLLAMSMPVPALFGTLGVSVAGLLIAGAVTRRWH